MVRVTIAPRPLIEALLTSSHLRHAEISIRTLPLALPLMEAICFGCRDTYYFIGSALKWPTA